LDGLTGMNSDYIRSLPPGVKRRIKALKNLQKKHMETEIEFHKQFHLLELKFQTQMAQFAQKRKEVVLGEVEPTESECEWEHDETEPEDEKIKIESIDETKSEATPQPMETMPADAKGIPDFWLTILKSSPPIDQTIEDHDEPILEKLKDIRCKLADDPNKMAFTLEFEFGENEYFENLILTKSYNLQNKMDEDDPLGYEGPEIVSCTGSNIKWKKGMNVTEKIVKKRQKHKGSGTVRTVEKKVLNDSFFNFFSPPSIQDDESIDSDTEALLDSDFQIGSTFKDRIVTRAVLYFTGEAQAAEREDDFDEDMFDEGDEGEDPDFEPADGSKQPECQQQ
jgi:nucleosome assembly protein 1-like 1